MDINNLTLEECRYYASKFTSRYSFSRSGYVNGQAYAQAVQNGWLDEICAHMPSRKLKLTLAQCKELALQFRTRTIFKRVEPGAYKTACDNGWLNEVCAHMPRRDSPRWPLDLCKDIASRYDNLAEFRRAWPGAYYAILRQGRDSLLDHLSRGNGVHRKPRKPTAV